MEKCTHKVTWTDEDETKSNVIGTFDACSRLFERLRYLVKSGQDDNHNVRETSMARI